MEYIELQCRYFLINGFFFFDSITKGKSVTYLKRIIILYIVWMIIYSPFWIGLKHLPLNIIFGVHHLWYLPAVILSSLFLLMIQKLSDKTKIAIVLCLYLIGTTIEYVGMLHFHAVESVSIRIYRNGLFFSPFFFISGYLIRKYNVHKKVRPLHIVMFAIFSVLLLLAESVMLIPWEKSIDMLFSLLFCCPAIFIATLATRQLSFGI